MQSPCQQRARHWQRCKQRQHQARQPLEPAHGCIRPAQPSSARCTWHQWPAGTCAAAAPSAGFQQGGGCNKERVQQGLSARVCTSQQLAGTATSHTHIHARAHACAHAHARTHAHAHARTLVCTHTRTHPRTCTRTHACVHLHARAHAPTFSLKLGVIMSFSTLNISGSRCTALTISKPCSQRTPWCQCCRARRGRTQHCCACPACAMPCAMPCVHRVLCLRAPHVPCAHCATRRAPVGTWHAPRVLCTACCAHLELGGLAGGLQTLQHSLPCLWQLRQVLRARRRQR